MQTLQKTFHHAGHAPSLDIVLPNLQQRHLAPFEQRALALVRLDAFGQAVDKETLHLDRPGHSARAGPPKNIVKDVDALPAPVGFGRQQYLSIEVDAMAEEFAHHE